MNVTEFFIFCFADIANRGDVRVGLGAGSAEDAVDANSASCAVVGVSFGCAGGAKTGGWMIWAFLCCGGQSKLKMATRGRRKQKGS